MGIAGRALASVDAATRRQVGRFLVAGGLATGADALVYFGLVRLAPDVGHDGAKATSFVVGTLVAYVANKFWTFGSRRRSLGELAAFVALYATAFGVNVGTNHGVLALSGSAPVAFVVATGCSTVLNFAGQKFWVFRQGAR